MLVFGIVLAFIPVIVNVISEEFYYYNKTLFSALFLIGEIGIVYSLVQYWLTAPQDGFWEYFKFIFSGLLVLIPYWNFEASDSEYKEKSTYDYVINGSLCGLFILGFFSALYKTMLNVSLYGISEYFGMFGVFVLFSIIIIIYVILTNLDPYGRPPLIFNTGRFILALTTMGVAGYYLDKAISLIPSWVFTIIGVGLFVAAYLIFTAIFSSNEIIDN
ncbi:hypothetical protein [Methanosarcina sp.]|uniref:hypothetical protein n=1 Tax=Methanosarcina sp. TaxID=2213 RepID=UPI003C785ACF